MQAADTVWRRDVAGTKLSKLEKFGECANLSISATDIFDNLSPVKRPDVLDFDMHFMYEASKKNSEKTYDQLTKLCQVSEIEGMKSSNNV